MKGNYFNPVVGETYKNRNGGSYQCLRVYKKLRLRDTSALFKRVSDGWTFCAHGILMYEDGTIEWDRSSGGNWLPDDE